ncbi:DNA cytosine methyltransferase [Mycoplasma marinum]|uniref:Cytosine-specific methyltransferase n=1 Tax=Mycoplasma marinum TaxID=1937190 RepID=A0A4R0XT96_9MOLU|nr:DNA (cytosine-5-)-methyltransferase [Mycoplasma marinum]TCG10967.1 DNA (cytosine-5-)-methyltransferase [Mycoplasma marinum]
MNKKLTVGTLFSGIGAPEWALKRLGIEHDIVFACDNGEVELTADVSKEVTLLNNQGKYSEAKLVVDEAINKRKRNFVKESYLKNYELDENDFHHDVTLLDGKQYKNKVDVIVGGSPCQAFSAVGYKRGLEDARGTLFYEFARIISQAQPKAFIYENVAGLLTHDKGKTWKIIWSIFESLGYNLHWKKINSKNYGIPQNRNRIFVVGIKKRNDFTFEEEVELKYTMQDFLESKVKMGDFSFDSNGSIYIKKTSKRTLSIDDKYYPSEKVIKHIMSPGTKNYFSKIATDLPIARPILATMHKMHRASVDNYITTKKGLRMITPREATRLMGFTDEFIIHDSRLRGYKQAGNSIVVDVMMSIWRSLLKEL